MDTLKGAGFMVERVYGTTYCCSALKSRNRWIFDGPVCGMERGGRFVIGLYNETEILESDEL